MPEDALFFDTSKDREPTLQAMNQAGLQVVSVDSPEAVFNALKQKKFHILVSEINVDPLSPFLTECHKLLKPHGTPHLVVTDSRDLFQVSLTETFHVRPILFKPVDNTILLSALRYHLLNHKNGTVLCSTPNMNYFNRSFQTMGFNVQAFSRMSDYQMTQNDTGFIVYEEGFEGASPIQLIQRLAQSKKKVPLFFFLKKMDAVLESVLKKYGPYKIEIPPYNWDEGEETLKKMILGNVPSPPAPKAEAIELKTPLKETDKGNSTLNPMDEIQTGRVSVNAFLQALPAKIPNQNFRSPLALFIKMRGAFQRQKCLEFLSGPQIKEVLFPLTDAYRTGNRLLRETILELLSEVKDKAVMDTFVLALRDPDPEIRQTALSGLQNFPLSETAKYFQVALKDPHVKIRSYAGKLLETHTDWAILNDFFQAQQTGDVALKRSFLKYLDSNSPKLEDPAILLPIFNSKDTVLKEGILDLLITQKQKKITPFLKLAAATEERILHRLVMEGFKMIQDPEGIPILLKYLDGKDSTLAESAIQSILDSHATAKNLALFFRVMEKGNEALRDHCIQVVKNFKEDESRPVLQLALKSGSTGNKLAAIDAMMSWKNESLVASIAPLLEDTDRSVRAFVSKHMSDRVDKACIEPLIRVFPRLKDDESKQFTATLLAKLVQAEEDVTYWMKILHSDTFSTLTRILQESGISLGKFTTQVLGKHISENASFEIILKTLYDPNVEAKAEAALVLGEQKNPEAIPHLIRFIDNENWYVRKSVIESLGKLNARDTASLILKKVTDENPSVRYTAAATLETFEFKFKETLFPLIFKETTEKVCDQLVRLLSPVNDFKAAEFHLARLSSTSPAIRVQSAAEILGLWTEADVKLLTSWLSSDKWQLRLTALLYFAKKNPALFLENSARFITDPSEDIRKLLLTFLIEQQKENPGPVLLRFVADESVEIRRMLLSECEKIPFPEKLDILIESFKKEKDPVLQSHLIDLLAMEKDPRIAETLGQRYGELPEVLQKKMDAIIEKYLNEK